MNTHDLGLQECRSGDQLAPPEDIDGKDQLFCCNSVESSGKGTGDDCSAIGEELINSCSNVLYCSGNWTKKDGVITCL
jgi:hypothetical protein